MTATYDEQGYVYPDGFDPETGDGLEGRRAAAAEEAALAAASAGMQHGQAG